MKCFLTLLYIFSFLLINAHPEDKLFQHPRGLITPYQQEKIRERVKREPYISMFNKIKETTKRIEQRNKEEQDNKVYRLANLAKHQSFMYVMTNDSYWADKAYLASYRVLQDSNYVMNPF